MAEKNFVVEVPISVKGGAAVAGGAISGESKSQEKNNSEMKKLNKNIVGNIDILSVLSSVLGDVMKILQPLFKILSLLFVIIFLPFLPIMKDLVKIIADLIGGFVKLFGGEINFAEFIKSFVGPALLGILKIIGDLAILIAKGLWEVFKGLISLIWEGIKFIGESLANVAVFIFDFIKSAFEALGDLSLKIWEFIKGLFSGTIDVVGMVWDFIKTLFNGTIEVVSNVWDFIKNLFKGTINVASTVWNWFKGLFSGGGGGSGVTKQDFISRPGQAPVSFSPQDTIIGVKDLSTLGGGSTTINIIKPTLRNESDIKLLANEVSRVMQRQTKGRFS